MSDDNKQPTFSMKWPLYVRMGWGLLVVFALVGNCAGKSSGAVVVLAISTLIWAGTKMLQEAIDAYLLLRLMNRPPEPPKDDQSTGT